jgi:DNA-binding transcriptional LysR family regulator
MQTGKLRLFCALAETGSFTRAADIHYLTQSAITQMFHALERDAGQPLATRRPFRLNRAGELYHEHSREILRLYDQMQSRLQSARDADLGVIELAACHSIRLHQLPPVLAQFQRAHPRVEIRVRHDFIERVHEQVLANVVDLGLVCYPRRRRGLAVDPFRHERLVLVCQPQQALAARPAVAIADLKGQRLVAWNEVRWSPFLKNVPGWQRHLFEPRHEFDQVELVKCAVEQGEGMAILPEVLVRAVVAAQRLAAVPFADGGPTEPLAVIHRQRKRLTPAMKKFIEFLKQSEPGKIPSPVGTCPSPTGVGEGGAAG